MNQLGLDASVEANAAHHADYPPAPLVSCCDCSRVVDTLNRRLSTMDNNQTDKAQLLKLIIEQGILHETEHRPVLARDGKTHLRWVMNFLGLSLHYEGLQLAAQALLTLLSSFKGRQLATIGTAAVPLMSACILASKGHYTGLMVRPQRKTYGTANLIDGQIRPHEPVIVIDDSIGSGTNMLDCIEKLEQAGLYVEGCACLVRFGYDSGYASLLERGYRVVYLFDQLTDISPRLPHEPPVKTYPIKASLTAIQWDEQALADYLSPFQVIRRCMQHYWQTGRLLRPPRVFNQPLEASGGLWISLRTQDLFYTQQGRQGLWNFPDEPLTATNLALVQCAWLLARQLAADPLREARLDQSALGLSLCSELVETTYGDFDFNQHGLAVRSLAAPWKMGGALPKMPGIQTASHLLHHARFHNTQLRPYEPFLLYRYTVKKLIEPGAEWPVGGSSALPQWDEKNYIVQPLANALLALAQAQHQRILPPPLKPLFIPASCQWLFVSVYLNGQLLACAGTIPHHPSAALPILLQTASQDPRWQAKLGQPGILTLKLYLLSEASYLGLSEQLSAFGNMSLGQDAIALSHQEQFALILPDVVVQQAWNIEQLQQQLYKKAGLAWPYPQVHWQRYRCRLWQFSTVNPTAVPLTTERLTPTTAIDTTYSYRRAYLHFVERQQQNNGAIYYAYQAALDQVQNQQPVFNTAWILWCLSQTQDHLAPPWDKSYTYLIDAIHTQTLDTHSSAYCLLALSQHPEWRQQAKPSLAKLVQQLQASLNQHGQWPKPAITHYDSHYSIELLALIHAEQAGLYIDHLWRNRSSERLFDYVRYYARPHQYPQLLETLTAIHQFSPYDCSGLIQSLHKDLVQWQQPDGGWLPEHPHLSPTLFSAQALTALLISGYQDQSVLERTFYYLYGQTVLSSADTALPNPLMAEGGLYSGLLDGQLMTIHSALALRTQAWVELEA